MLRRSRELLLEWGHFSRAYESRTGMKKVLSWTEVGHAWLRVMFILCAPILGTLFLAYVPYPTLTFQATFDTKITQIIFCSLLVMLSYLSFPVIVNHELASIPIGLHNFSCGLFATCIITTVSFMVHFIATHIFGCDVLVPMMGCIVAVISGIAAEFFVSIKFIPTLDPRFGKKVKLAIAHYIHFPRSMRFDGLKKRAVRRNVNVLFLIQVLCAVYVILASVFVNVGTTGQAMIVPLFYFVRVACETYARTLPQHSTCTLLSQRRTSTERLIVPVFGSDAIPLITFFIVAFHETCLAVRFVFQSLSRIE